ncbi:MAG TPA: ATP-dependent DNA ligase, partial [Rhodanobacteraceae bacterium]|nr:ATP-dependent DNA ligase [Rhodanobacteraceae bacterium]
VADTRSRLAKVRALAERLRAFSPDEIAVGTHYLAGSTPQGRLGVGYAALRAATPASEPTLTLRDVDRALDALANLRGAGAGAKRVDALATLFARATQPERDFLIRLVQGELRQGALLGVMIDAIAAAATMPPVPVRRAMMYASDVGAVAKSALVEGEAGLAKFQLEILAPIAPMLAQTAADPAEALRGLGGEAAFEWKMDGARIQAHKSGATVRIYTRNLNEVSAAIPEIVETVRALPAAELILDGEAIAFDGSGRPHPFQVTMRRFGRRLDVDALRAELPMRAFFFDCLRLGERSLADSPLRERHAALVEAVPEALRIPRLVTASTDDAQAFYDAALAAGHEGLMAKSLDAPYEAGNRGAGWLKIKRAHTLDLVVIAAEWGHGRRSGKLSNLHLGAIEPATGEYVMLGKTFKGLTDAMLDWQTKALLAREVRSEGITVFVRPELVVEIAFSDLQASPRYPGGLALRLARVKRYRDDKDAETADTMDSVRRIYEAQG